MKRSILFAVVGAAALACTAAFAHDCCSHCGCQQNVTKVCRLVCEMKEVKEVCYDCKCEDFCIPGPSCKCGQKRECSCAARHGQRTVDVWQPSTCATIHTRHHLLKREVVKQVPTYKWVVETVCGGCAGKCAQQSLPPGAAEMAGPKPDLSDKTTAENKQSSTSGVVPASHRTKSVLGKFFGQAN